MRVTASISNGFVAKELSSRPTWRRRRTDSEQQRDSVSDSESARSARRMGLGDRSGRGKGSRGRRGSDLTDQAADGAGTSSRATRDRQHADTDRSETRFRKWESPMSKKMKPKTKKKSMSKKTPTKKTAPESSSILDGVFLETQEAADAADAAGRAKRQYALDQCYAGLRTMGTSAMNAAAMLNEISDGFSLGDIHDAA